MFWSVFLLLIVLPQAAAAAAADATSAAATVIPKQLKTTSPRKAVCEKNGSVTSTVIEHPVFFYMPGLSDEPHAEYQILQGLYDLQFNNFSDLYFLYTGRVNRSSGVAFTHALVSRFPTVEALQVYYSSAITDIATQMGPWLQREYAVDYEATLPNDEILLDGMGNLAFHVTFIKVNSNASTTDIDNMIQSFLGLADELDYVTQLTAGENLYIRESYRTSSHSFSAYLPSVEALERWQEDSAFLSVLEDKILPMAQSYASVALVPFVPQSAAASS